MFYKNFNLFISLKKIIITNKTKNNKKKMNNTHFLYEY